MLNTDIYRLILNNGLQLTSPAVSKAESVSSALGTAENLLNSPALDTLGINTDILSTTRNAISMASHGMTGGVMAMASRAQSALSNSALAQQANRLDAIIDSVPQGCANITELFGSIMGEADGFLDNILTSARDLLKTIGDLLSGLLPIDEFETMLAPFVSGIKDAVDGLSDLLNKEKAKLEEIINKIKSSALAQQISALWNNPCTQGVMKEVLPDDIKNALL